MLGTVALEGLAVAVESLSPYFLPRRREDDKVQSSEVFAREMAPEPELELMDAG